MNSTFKKFPSQHITESTSGWHWRRKRSPQRTPGGGLWRGRGTCPGSRPTTSAPHLCRYVALIFIIQLPHSHLQKTLSKSEFKNWRCDGKVYFIWSVICEGYKMCIQYITYIFTRDMSTLHTDLTIKGKIFEISCKFFLLASLLIATLLYVYIERKGREMFLWKSILHHITVKSQDNESTGARITVIATKGAPAPSLKTPQTFTTIFLDITTVCIRAFS